MGIAASDPAALPLVAEFRDAFTKLGWAEHQNLRVEVRWGGGDANRLKTFAKELVDLRPHAILSQSTAATGAVASETRTIPIVFTIVADPIGSGLATSLARPGGNITGFSNTDPAIGSKWVGLLGAFAVVNRERIIELAARYNVPTIYPDLFFAESGGLIAYGANFADEFRSAAGYIDRILKGTKPADLPIEQPNKFDLFINLRAAKAAWSNHPTDAAQESIREDAIILPFLLITRPSCCQTGFAYIIANC